MSQDTELDATVQPKYTRYRSVRHAAAAKEAPVEPAPADQTNALPARSMSRYRRPRAVSKADQPASPPLTAVPAVPALPLAQSSAAAFTRPTRRVTEPASTATHAQPARNISEGRWARQAAETEEQRRGAQRARDYEERLQAQAVEEKLAEQKRKDLERLEATLDAAAVSSPVKEKFSFFSRKRAHTKTAPPPPPAAAAPVSTAGPSSSSISRSVSNDTPRRSNEPPLPRAGAVVVPGTDAPISAVNAGERVGSWAVEIYQC
jgi:hypothetical protein